jgi:Cation transport ATPase
MELRRVKLHILGMSDPGGVWPLEEALRGQEGVIWATVNFAAGEATVIYDPSTLRWPRLFEAVRALGYEATLGCPSAPPSRLRRIGVPVLAGAGGALALIGLYLALVTLAQGWAHAWSLLWGDRWLVGAIAFGFGVQVGLYVYLRRIQRRAVPLRSPTTVAAAGTGTSSVAMVACCAHHVTDALPLLGLSAAATLLNQYRVPFMLVGIGMNSLGILLMLRWILQAHGHRDTGWLRQVWRLLPLRPGPLGGRS